jgi:hypothetical protein
LRRVTNKHVVRLNGETVDQIRSTPTVSRAASTCGRARAACGAGFLSRARRQVAAEASTLRHESR